MSISLNTDSEKDSTLNLSNSPTKSKLRLKDAFGNFYPLKWLLMSIIGFITYPFFVILNKVRISGLEHLHNLPKENVLFVSNHETYFADVIGLYHVFGASKWKLKQLYLPFYLFNTRAKSYYIAAEETMMDGGIIPRIFAYTGAITIKRSFRKGGQDITRGADFKAPAKVKRGLESGWVINFPQGTTSPSAPVRKGAASIIRAYNPIVVPVQIAGFRKAFGKKGLSINKIGVKIDIKFSEPKQFGEEADLAEIQEYLVKHIQEAPPINH